MRWDVERDEPITYTSTRVSFCGMKVVEETLPSFVKDHALTDSLNAAGDAQRKGKFASADKVLRRLFAERLLSDLPIEMLRPLTIRVADTLYREKIDSVADLLRCKLPDVLSWYNFGPLSRSLLGDRMRTFGLNFAGQHDYAWIKSFPKEKVGRLDRMLCLPTFQLPAATEGLPDKIQHFLVEFIRHESQQCAGVELVYAHGGDRHEHVGRWSQDEDEAELFDGLLHVERFTEAILEAAKRAADTKGLGRFRFILRAQRSVGRRRAVMAFSFSPTCVALAERAVK